MSAARAMTGDDVIKAREHWHALYVLDENLRLIRQCPQGYVFQIKFGLLKTAQVESVIHMMASDIENQWAAQVMAHEAWLSERGFALRER